MRDRYRALGVTPEQASAEADGRVSRHDNAALARTFAVQYGAEVAGIISVAVSGQASCRHPADSARAAR